jgi:uncharacterized hydrophobic protein (TIGR00271 family)
MEVVITILYETECLVAADLRWALRIAAQHGGDITFVVPSTGDSAKDTKIDLEKGAESDPLRSALGESLHVLLDQELTPSGWIASARQSSTEIEDAKPRLDGAPIRVALRSMPTERIAPTALSILEDPRRDLLVAVMREVPRELTIWRTLGRELLRGTGCEFICVIPGQRLKDGEILFQPSRRQAVRPVALLAIELAKRHNRTATGLWIEPDIGPDSESVGRRTLDRMLQNALGDQASQVTRRVEIKNSPEVGFLQACSDERYEVAVMGFSKPNAAEFSEGQVPVRIARGTNQPSLIFTRAAIPMRTRFQRFLHSNLRQIVPQLQREERIAFVENVQSNSEWNFDFVALMGLATGIATLGLIGDSPAVIIGAMLVAPLMTPLMGIGLSIVQGNLRLAAMTSRTALLGFVFAFGLALTIGALDLEFAMATPEMYGRHWPTLVDVAVAFVAGLAAAYASGRPGLLAALPGVAIAASLVPPIAVSGLAISIGQYELATGAMLLFAVNVVSIIFASALTLWAVGLHSRTGLNRGARILVVAISAITIATAIAVAVSPPMSAPPLALVKAVETVLGDDYRLRDVRLKREGRPVLQIDLGGSIQDHPNFHGQLLVVAREYLGQNATVRLTYRHEAELK